MKHMHMQAVANQSQTWAATCVWLSVLSCMACRSAPAHNRRCPGEAGAKPCHGQDLQGFGTQAEG